jgi:hypothetical protein
MSASRDGSLLYVSGDGLHLRDGAEGAESWLAVTYTVPTPPLLITNARIVDGTGSPPTEARDLLLRNGRIERSRSAGNAEGQGCSGDGRCRCGRDAGSHRHALVSGRRPTVRGALYNGVTVLRDQGRSRDGCGPSR